MAVDPKAVRDAYAAYIENQQNSSRLYPRTCFEAGYEAAAQGQEWRDIESAPRDGTWIVVSQWNREEVRFTRMFWASIAQWTERWSTPRWWDGVEPSGLAEPTHWMATVPPNPSAAEG